MKRFLIAYAFLWATLLLLAATGNARLFWAWYDAWVGVFVDTKKRAVYLIPFPCVVFKAERI